VSEIEAEHLECAQSGEDQKKLVPQAEITQYPLPRRQRVGGEVIKNHQREHAHLRASLTGRIPGDINIEGKDGPVGGGAEPALEGAAAALTQQSQEPEQHDWPDDVEARETRDQILGADEIKNEKEEGKPVTPDATFGLPN